MLLNRTGYTEKPAQPLPEPVKHQIRTRLKGRSCPDFYAPRRILTTGISRRKSGTKSVRQLCNLSQPAALKAGSLLKIPFYQLKSPLFRFPLVRHQIQGQLKAGEQCLVHFSADLP